MWPTLRRNVFVVKWVALRLISCFANRCTGGSIYETLCARVGRQTYIEASPRPIWRGASFILDLLFIYEDRHCYRQFIAAAHRTRNQERRMQWLWQMH